MNMKTYHKIKQKVGGNSERRQRGRQKKQGEGAVAAPGLEKEVHAGSEVKDAPSVCLSV